MKRIVATAGALAVGLGILLGSPAAAAAAEAQQAIPESVCELGGGEAQESEKSPTGKLCVGGVFNDLPVSDEDEPNEPGGPEDTRP
ncbi:hypothetical protein [Amycolatopsis anabasis]|uniref:hypothetical protein n=1 Tax=Amycolatopsis anabasis TaxID=1840409 RepID=UPI00131EA0B9|nr:hypothetical protein [Amycolatopsis anabasis]